MRNRPGSGRSEWLRGSPSGPFPVFLLKGLTWGADGPERVAEPKRRTDELKMRYPPHSDFVPASEIRRAIVSPGDLRGEVGFQNDVNAILASLGEEAPPIVALMSPLESAWRGGQVLARGPSSAMGQLLSRARAARAADAPEAALDAAATRADVEWMLAEVA